MGTNKGRNREREHAVKNYLLNNINSEGYGVKVPETDKEKIDFLFNTFHREYGWHIDAVGEPKALAEWLSGLPSVCTVDFYYYDQIILGKMWGFLKEDATESEEWRFCSNFFNASANALLQMHRNSKRGLDIVTGRKAI